MIIKSLFAKNFRLFRERAHLGQEALAQKIGVNVRTISIYETGKGYPKVDLLMKISSVLKVPISQFFVEKSEGITKEDTLAVLPSTDLEHSIPDDSALLEKINTYKRSIKNYRKFTSNENSELFNELIETAEKIVDDLEAEYLQKKETEAKLNYATGLIKSLAKSESS